MTVGLRTESGELTDAAYERQNLRLRAETDGRWSNSEEVRFEPFSAWAVEPVVAWFIAGPDGVELATEPLDEPEPVREGHQALFKPGDLVVRIED